LDIGNITEGKDTCDTVA